MCCNQSRITRLREGSLRDCGHGWHCSWGSQMDRQSGMISYWLASIFLTFSLAVGEPVTTNLCFCKIKLDVKGEFMLICENG